VKTTFATRDLGWVPTRDLDRVVLDAIEYISAGRTD